MANTTSCHYCYGMVVRVSRGHVKINKIRKMKWPQKAAQPLRKTHSCCKELSSISVN